MINFKDKVVVVTGAAGNLGRSVVKGFLDHEGCVCAVDHRPGRLERIFSSLNENKDLHLFDKVDVTDAEGMAAFAEEVFQQFGGVDILVNTVGGFTYGETVFEISSDTWARMIDLNVMSFLNSAAVFVPGMVKQGWGKIISIGSKGSLKGGAKTGAYAAAKSALLRLTESMAEELKDLNIQVNCVLPSIIDGPENREAMPSADFSRWVNPDDVTQVIIYLASPLSDAISGAAIPVFGRT